MRLSLASFSRDFLQFFEVDADSIPNFAVTIILFTSLPKPYAPLQLKLMPLQQLHAKMSLGAMLPLLAVIKA